MTAVVAPDRGAHLAVLRDGDSSMADVMRAVAALDRDGMPTRVKIGVSANITAELLSTYLRRHALLAGASAAVTQGSFDSHFDNVQRFVNDGVEQLVVLNFFDQLMPALEARVAELDPKLVGARCERLADELRLVLGEGREMTAVFVTLLHRLRPSSPDSRSAAIDAAVADFNRTIEAVVAEHPNATAISTEDIVATVGRHRALSSRFYFQAAAPYRPAFWDELARRLLLASRGAGSYLYKALILDCDNTLWGGVVGESLLEGIALDPTSYPGNVFWRVQNELLALQRRGVLLCLCSKNNPADVAEVLARHPHQLIRDEHLVLKKVNWDDKVENIIAIADELSLGLGSFVFLDDSPFEVEAVRERLPMVTAYQVPVSVHDYPALMDEVRDLFLCGRPDGDGADKTEQYRARALAQAATRGHTSRADYLASLDLRVEVRRDRYDAIPRIAELSQKSNQFNLTTIRYTEAQVADLIAAHDAAVYTLRAGDRFGDAGIVAIAVVHFAGGTARVESFLMSCRILGRGVEFAPWPIIAADAQDRGCRRLEAEWRASRRNQQVGDFYDRLGLPRLDAAHDRHVYRADLAEVSFPVQSHIRINHG